ncbi:hypothetical protein RB195_008563 [Necator americanus]|uniref:Secreted protein n=1 Tax=Necator americanus TaxID=51031 RepID=A0ABR1CR42_NECAM
MDMTAILISIDALISSVFAHTSMKPIAFTVLFLAVFAVDYCKSIPTMHNKADQFAERLLGKFGSSFIRIQKNDCCRINQALNCCTLRWYWNEIQL